MLEKCEKAARVPEVAAIDTSKTPMPYPGYVVPDDTMLSELIPPPPVTQVRTPEPPTPSREQQGGHSCHSNGSSRAGQPKVPLPEPGSCSGCRKYWFRRSPGRKGYPCSRWFARRGRSQCAKTAAPGCRASPRFGTRLLKVRL